MKHEFTEGQMYRVTLLVKHSHTFEGGMVHEFHGADYDLTISDSDIVKVEDPPWEVQDGDVYFVGGNVYQVVTDWDELKVETTGLSGTSPLSDYDFSEEQLIYRENR